MSTSKVHFLDLEIFQEKGKLLHRTFYKSLNLFLYKSALSYQPNHLWKGITKGLIINFQRQNVKEDDFLNACKQLYSHLVKRGYPQIQLKNYINLLVKMKRLGTLTSKNKIKTTASKKREVFLSLLYHSKYKQTLQQMGIKELEEKMNITIRTALKSNKRLGTVFLQTKPPRQM